MKKREKCIICNSLGEEIFSLPYDDKELTSFFLNYYGNTENVKDFLKSISKYYYTILKCNNCQFIWQKYSLEHDKQKILYDNLINQKNSYRKSLDLETRNGKYYLNEINFLKNFFIKNKQINILDYGAGWGSWIKSIKSEYKNIYALELSENRINVLKENKIQTINENDKSNENLKFDFIRFEQVLEHLDDLNSIIKYLKNKSTNNSLIYISVPNSKILFSKFWKENLLIKGPIQPLEHLNSFTPKSLNKLFNNNSFSKISLIEIFLLFLKCDKFNYFRLKYFIKLIYNYFFSTTLIFKKN